MIERLRKKETEGLVEIFGTISGVMLLLVLVGSPLVEALGSPIWANLAWVAGALVVTGGFVVVGYELIRRGYSKLRS